MPIMDTFVGRAILLTAFEDGDTREQPVRVFVAAIDAIVESTGSGPEWVNTIVVTRSGAELRCHETRREVEDLIRGLAP